MQIDSLDYIGGKYCKIAWVQILHLPPPSFPSSTNNNYTAFEHNFSSLDQVITHPHIHSKSLLSHPHSCCPHPHSTFRPHLNHYPYKAFPNPSLTLHPPIDSPTNQTFKANQKCLPQPSSRLLLQPSCQLPLLPRTLRSLSPMRCVVRVSPFFLPTSLLSTPLLFYPHVISNPLTSSIPSTHPLPHPLPRSKLSSLNHFSHPTRTQLTSLSTDRRSRLLLHHHVKAPVSLPSVGLSCSTNNPIRDTHKTHIQPVNKSKQSASIPSVRSMLFYRVYFSSGYPVYFHFSTCIIIELAVHTSTNIPPPSFPLQLPSSLQHSIQHPAKDPALLSPAPSKYTNPS